MNPSPATKDDLNTAVESLRSELKSNIAMASSKLETKIDKLTNLVENVEITISDKVVDHEKRLTSLEKRVL